MWDKFECKQKVYIKDNTRQVLFYGSFYDIIERTMRIGKDFGPSTA